MAFSERINLIIDVATGNGPAGLKKLSADLKDADGAFAKAKVGATNLFDTIKAHAGTAALAAGTALVGFASKAIGDFQEVALSAGRLASSLGVTTEEASRLQEVAGDVGVGIGPLERAIGRMNRELGNSPEKFEEVGAAIARNADGTVNVTETFLNVVDALNRIPDPAARAVAAQKLLGRGWQDLSRVIALGADELRTQLESVEQGKIITDGQVARAEKFRDLMDELRGTVEELSVSLGGKFVAAANDALVPLTKLIDVAQRLDSFEVGGLVSLGDVLTHISKTLTGGYVVDGIEAIGSAVGATSDITGKLADGLMEMESATTALTGAVGGGIHVEREAARAKFEHQQRVDALAEAYMDSQGGMHAAEQATEDFSEALDAEIDDLNEAADAAQESADAHLAEADAILATVSARRSAADAQFALNDARRDFAEKGEAYNALLADEETTMADLAAAQDDAAQSAGAVADAALRVAEEQAKANNTTLTAAESGDIWRHSMLEQAAAAEGDLRGAILSYIDSVEDIPDEKMTEIQAAIARGDLAEAQRLLDEASETREAEITAEAETRAAERDLEDTRRRKRVAEILAAAKTQAAEEGLSGTAARKRVADIVARALTSSANSDLGLTARQRSSIVRAIAETGSAEGALNNVARNRVSTVRVRVVGNAGIGTPQAMAEGGINRGGVTLVGEEGPELVQMPSGSRVYTAGETEQMLSGSARQVGGSGASGGGGGGGGPMTINIYTGADPKAVVDAIKKYERFNGTGWRQ